MSDDNMGRSWDEWSHEERAIFLSHLRPSASAFVPMVATEAEPDDLQQRMDNLRADIECHDERLALAAEYDIHDAATTTRALQALKEPNTSWDRHAVARAWLKHYAPHRGFFVKVDAS